MPTLKHIYSPRLSADEIGDLRALADIHSARSPKLAGWLKDFAEFEIARRHAERLADPVDVEQPKLDCSRWSDGALLDSLFISNMMRKSLADREHAADLLEDVHATLLLWVRARFRGTDENDILSTPDAS